MSDGRKPWRVGRKVGRTIYDADDELIGVMDTPELALAVVNAINGEDQSERDEAAREYLLGVIDKANPK